MYTIYRTTKNLHFTFQWILVENNPVIKIGWDRQELRSSLGQDPSSFCLWPGADPVPQLSIPKSHWERAGLPGVLTPLKAQLSIPKSGQERAGLPRVLTNLRAQVRPPLLLKLLAQEGPTQSHQDMGTKEQPGTESFQFPSAPWSWSCATALHTQIPPKENW